MQFSKPPYFLNLSIPSSVKPLKPLKHPKYYKFRAMFVDRFIYIEIYKLFRYYQFLKLIFGIHYTLYSTWDTSFMLPASFWSVCRNFLFIISLAFLCIEYFFPPTHPQHTFSWIYLLKITTGNGFLPILIMYHWWNVEFDVLRINNFLVYGVYSIIYSR